MRSSDLYFYAASILWIVWILYIVGFFKWAVSLYFRFTYYSTNTFTYYFTPAPPKPTKPVDMEKMAELLDIWSPSPKMPGVWSSEENEGGERVRQQEKDVVVVVEDGFVLVENENGKLKR